MDLVCSVSSTTIFLTHFVNTHWTTTVIFPFFDGVRMWVRMSMSFIVLIKIKWLMALCFCSCLTLVYEDVLLFKPGLNTKIMGKIRK